MIIPECVADETATALLEQFVADMDSNDELRTQARNNSKEHFLFPFNDAFMDIVIERMTQNQKFCNTGRDLLMGVVYERLREQPNTSR